jgi:hypothetical protein
VASPYLPISGGALTGTLAVGGGQVYLDGNANAASPRLVGGTGGGMSLQVGSSNNPFTFYNNALTAVVQFNCTSPFATINTSGAWATFSDPRVKTAVAPYTQGLSALLQLEPIRYRYNGVGPSPADPDEVSRYGLDAKATQAVMPELVDEHDGYLTLNTNPLIYALVNACKELSARVQALEAALSR